MFSPSPLRRRGPLEVRELLLEGLDVLVVFVCFLRGVCCFFLPVGVEIKREKKGKNDDDEFVARHLPKTSTLELRHAHSLDVDTENAVFYLLTW